jgi:hypothetical protein
MLEPEVTAPALCDIDHRHQGTKTERAGGLMAARPSSAIVVA